MRILLISPYFPPQNAVACLRVHAFAQCWASAGEDVTVLTTAKRANQRGLDLPRHGFEVIELEYRASRMLEMLRTRFKSGGHQASGDSPDRNRDQSSTPTRSAVSWLRRIKERTGVFSSVRMPDLTDAWVRPAIAWARAHGPWDIVVSSSGPYTAHRAALAIKLMGGAGRWIADFRDLWTNNHAHSGLFPFTLIERSVEAQCFQHIDLLTTVSDGLAETLQRQSGKPVEVIYNGFDAAAIDALPAQRIFPLDHRMRLVYTGSLYPRGQDPSPLLMAMAHVRRERPDLAKRLVLVIAGQGGEMWLEMAKRLGAAEMIEVRGIVDRSQALCMQRDGDALILLDWNDPRQGVLTAKVFEYLRAGPPILLIGPAADSPLIRLVVKQAGRGIHVGDDAQRIRKTLIDLIEDPASIQLARNDQFIVTLTRQRQSARLLECMRNLL